ncbi:hypothetical protein Vretifemale_8126 [Volvox reticuliferus]|uniref:Uncharacterized protein n=1 Tax=Volvox reticuliferus TaxID=1737510 RepID=A0A8J4CEP8_9CHLO|nr:hypothetical protein Vretifemale_8126 [Volvox reticuliferus]
MHKRDGSIVQIWCCSKDLWPTHSPFQARASKNLHDTLHSGDLQYVVAMTEMHGYQYLFPINPRTTRLRKVLLRRLAELSELRRKEATCAELSKQADAVMEKLDLADRDLQLINVGGQFRVPGEAEKDAVWARKDELETEHKRLIEAIYNVGYDDRDIQANLRQIEHLVLNMKKLLQEGNQQAQAAARRSPRGCRPSSILFRPQDPQRQVGLPGAAGLRESETNSPIGGCDSLHAAKRPRLQAAEGDQAVQEGSSALSTQLQLQYLQAQADLLMLLCCNKVISHDGTEDWGKLDREAHSRASQLECYCQDLEAQLRAKGQAVPDQVQVARHYAMMVYEQRQLHAQGLPHRGTNPEQAPGPGQQHVLLRQDDTNSRASPARACESEQESCQRQQQQQAPHDGLGHGMSSHLPYHPAQPRHRVPPVKWKGAIALGQNGAVEKLLRTGRLQAERMQSCGSSRSSITDLKNTWIPLVFPLLEAVPDLKDLIPEVGLLTFEDERELASMVDFARRQGWYADRVSSGVACGKSALIFNDGYLAHQEMSVYVLTHKSQWAQEVRAPSRIPIPPMPPNRRV